jgi:hypothetical protein
MFSVVSSTFLDQISTIHTPYYCRLSALKGRHIVLQPSKCRTFAAIST